VAIAALLGLTESTNAFGIIERKSNQEKLYMQMMEDEDSGSEDDEYDQAHVQTNKILEKVQGWGGWAPGMGGFPGTVNEYGNWVDPYERTAPVIFTGDAAD
jgi:hypothetical protein